MIKIRNKPEIYDNIVIQIKGIYKKPLANIMFLMATNKAFPLRSEKKYECLLLPLQHRSGGSSQGNYTKEIKGSKNWTEK